MHKALLAPAKLTAFGRVTAPQTNARLVTLKRVAVDDARLDCQVIRAPALQEARTINAAIDPLLALVRCDLVSATQLSKIPALTIVRRRDAGPSQPNQMPSLDRNVALVRTRSASQSALKLPGRHFRRAPHYRQVDRSAGVTARARDFKIAKARVQRLAA
jgi:hypothetical protein